MTQTCPFKIELIGYNDGIPYQEAETETYTQALELFETCKKAAPHVVHRLILVYKEEQLGVSNSDGEPLGL